MILNDRQITKLALGNGMITPFVGKSIKENVTELGQPSLQDVALGRLISFGLSSFGYDLRVKNGFQIFTNTHNGVIDPKNFDPKCIVSVSAKEGEHFITIPPNSFALAESVEYFKMPDDVLGVVYGKSTYARCGIITNVTPLEPGWEGTVTLEISNTTTLPARIYINEGLCQVLFLKGEKPDISYSDRSGKYNKQSGITHPTV